jgi:hypothetical protein
MVLAALVSPTGSLENVRLVGDTVTAAEPVPLRLTVCGLFAALSVKVREPLRVPVVVGEKVTPTAQFAPAAMLVPQVLLAMAKSPVAAMLVKLRAMGISLVSVTDLALLVFPTTIVPKLRELLERVTGEMPVPVRETDCGLREELLVTVNVAFKVPVVTGVKVTWIVQLADAANVLGLAGQLLVDE